MKVLMCSPYRYPAEGGLTTHLKMLSSGLVGHGHEVGFVTPSNVPKLPRILFFDGPRVALNRAYSGLGIYWYMTLVTSYLCRSVDAALSAERYDVINMQHVIGAPAVKRVAARHGVPVVLTVHGDTTNEHRSAGTVRKGSFTDRRLAWEEIRAYLCADQIVAVDERLRAHVQGMLTRTEGGSNEHVCSVPNFIDTNIFCPLKADMSALRAEFGLSSNKTILLCPRRLVAKNGVVAAAEAFSKIANKYPNLVLVYAGSGALRKDIERVVHANQLGDRVIFLGSIPHEKMDRLCACVDLAVVPSTRSEGVEEATSLSALELMACERPVICTEVGGLKQLITDGQTGFSVPDKDTDLLAGAIAKALDDAEACRRLGTAARQYVIENHSYLSGAKRYLEAYEAAIRRVRPGARHAERD